MTLLRLAWIKLKEYYDVQHIEGYPIGSFSQVELFENNGDSSSHNYAEKLYGCHGNLHECRLWELKFSEWKITRMKNHEAETPNSKPF